MKHTYLVVYLYENGRNSWGTGNNTAETFGPINTRQMVREIERRLKESMKPEPVNLVLTNYILLKVELA